MEIIRNLAYKLRRTVCGERRPGGRALLFDNVGQADECLRELVDNAGWTDFSVDDDYIQGIMKTILHPGRESEQTITCMFGPPIFKTHQPLTNGMTEKEKLERILEFDAKIMSEIRGGHALVQSPNLLDVSVSFLVCLDCRVSFLCSAHHCVGRETFFPAQNAVAKGLFIPPSRLFFSDRLVEVRARADQLRREYETGRLATLTRLAWEPSLVDCTDGAIQEAHTG